MDNLYKDYLKVFKPTMHISDRPWSICPSSSLHISLSFCSVSYNGICSNRFSFLLVISQLGKKVPMETETYNSLGGTIIFLALFGQRYIFGLSYMNKRKHTPLHKRDTKQNQNRPMEITPALTDFLYLYSQTNVMIVMLIF